MTHKPLRIGTRDSQLAVWQATLVQSLLQKAKISSELVFIKSEGDIDTITPLYELGVQGIFTKTLDAALLNNRIDIAVHSMKDVPTKMALGLQQAAVLKRASYSDAFIYKSKSDLALIGFENGKWSTIKEARKNSSYTIATSSIRRMAQWLHRYPDHKIENLRGNVNTRLRKVEENNWNGAIFAAAGLERINLRPENAIDLDWMLPAPAQGAILVACRTNDKEVENCCLSFHDNDTALCTSIERDFLAALQGGCSTPISALARIINNEVHFQGNIASVDGKQILEINKTYPVRNASVLGTIAANEILLKGGHEMIQNIRKKELS